MRSTAITIERARALNIATPETCVAPVVFLRAT